jgi:putative NIF3 family GTP cyclohydrolase 1 type 2
MNVKQVTEVILKKACGDFRLEHTCDLLVHGSWESEVTGIASTFIVTPEVIHKAAAQNINMIITHEPTWFTGNDLTDWCREDSVYLAKKKLLEETHMNVWRFHDHMHMGAGDLIYSGLVRELDWEDYKSKESLSLGNGDDFLKRLSGAMNKWLYILPEITVGGLAEELKRKLNMKTIRLIGDPFMRISRAGILVGGGSLGLGVEQMPMQFMQNADVHVMLCGDITEWTLCSYVNDAAQMGFRRAMLVLGHERTEEAGMKHLPKWLEPELINLPVVFIDAREPFLYI